jgi:hypothetical protein
MDNKETAWAPSVSLPLRTTGRPRLDRADCHQTAAATALPVPMTSLPSLPAAAPLSSTASGGYKGRPPPTMEHPFFFLLHHFTTPVPLRPPPYPPPLSRHGQPAPASLGPKPLLDRLDHAPSTTPPSMTSPHRELPTTTPKCLHPTVVPLRPTTHCCGAHSSSEDLPVSTP